VLITGETGTGKNVVAKSIHHLSGVGSGCFMDINCAALPENLIEAELFGYEKGAFTGAAATKKGIFELADGGTIFLDEIGELPLNLQSKLLGVLDEQKIKRLGGQSFKHISVRIMAATNVNLEEAVIHKKFRQDLFYRLSVLPIHIPPLRERREDIIPLCRYFIAKLAQSHEITLPSSEIEALVNYQWPGNVRELKNIIERALIFQQDNEIYPSNLLSRDFRTSHEQQKTSGESITPLADVEKNHIIQVLSQVNHNHTHAARGLGISRSTLLRKMKIYSIPPTVS
jgi:transcriptional regulator with PAS, ATPase and Fis domain